MCEGGGVPAAAYLVVPADDVAEAAGAEALLHLPGAAGLRLQGRRPAHGGAAALGLHRAWAAADDVSGSGASGVWSGRPPARPPLKEPRRPGQAGRCASPRPLRRRAAASPRWWRPPSCLVVGVSGGGGGVELAGC